MRSIYKLVLTVAILSPFFSLAQGNYKQGFVIKPKGDTLKGYIDLKEWGSNPKEINFKTSLDQSNAQVFTVNDIDFYAIPKIAAYKSYITSISLDETDVQRLEHQKDTSTKTDRVFLKVLQPGNNVTLYNYRDDLKERFYIYDNQAKVLAELTYRAYFVPNEKNVTVTYQNAYKQQLLNIAEKFKTYNDNLKSLIEEAEYRDVDLIDICRKINHIKPEEEVKANRNYFKFFAGVGANYSTVDLSGSFPLYNVAPKSHSSFSPRVSLGISANPIPDVGRFYVKLELAYSSSDFKTVGEPYYEDPSIKSTYSFQQHTISVIPQFQYNLYNTDPFKFYLDIGLSANFSTYKGDSYLNPVTNETQTNFGLDKRWFSVPLKAGIIFDKKFDISIAYSYKQSLSDDVNGAHRDYNYSLNLQTIQFGLSYIF